MDESEVQEQAPATEAPATEAQPATTPTAELQTSPPAETTPAWLKELDTADPKQLAEALRTHPRVRGIVGSELQKARDEERRRVGEEQQRLAEERQEAQLRELAKNNPLDFAEKWLGDDAKKSYQRQIDDMSQRERSRMAEQIGRAMRESEFWGDLTPEDHQAVASALVGLSDDAVLPTFNRVVFERALARSSEKRLSEYKQTLLGKEREAIRKEEAANLLNSSAAPSTAAPKSAPGGNPAQLSDKEFSDWWARKYGR